MTKTFKEKLDILPIKNIEHPVGNTKYYASVHIKPLIAQADEEIANLKSQLQQQSLPVVPEYVGKDIKKLKSFNKDGKNFHVFDLSYYSEESINWVEDDYDNYVKFYLAVATGKYQVEKPQLFYLKHIDMSKTDEKYDHYLIKTREGGFISSGFNHSKSYKGQLPDFNDCFKFTQSDIDSMETGSYEQIKATE